jgi:mono/diheme cytochrome c family protein
MAHPASRGVAPFPTTAVAKLTALYLPCAALAATLITACNFEYYKDSNAGGTYSSGEVSFAMVQEKVFEPSCVSCHGNRGGVNLESYSSAFSNLSAINTAVFTKHSMPQGGSLSADQLAILQAWINEGGPEFASSPTSPEPQPSPSPIGPADALIAIRQSFDQSVRPLVAKACMECHDSHAKPTGLIGDLPIGRQIEWGHIRKASVVLDFSGTFPDWSPQESDPLFFLSEIKTVIENGTMPLSSFKIFHEFDHTLLTYSQETTIVDWVDSSTALWAKANPQPPTASRFFSSRCLGCHNSDNRSGGFAFEKSGDQILVPDGKTASGIPFLDQADPENSAVYLVLLTDPSQRRGLPQMPDGSSASDAERALVLDWIHSSAGIGLGTE